MTKFKIIALTFIIIFAGVLRFYKLDKIPPSLNWDEVAAAYNAWTIFHWGADEYGTKFPITFKNFGDDKHPVHIYLTAPIMGIFGPTDYAARSGSAALGVFGVILIYLLSKKLFRSELAAIFSALFLAVSPYDLQFSRGLWEANFALFFFLLGLTLFYYKKFPWAFLSFGLSFFSYHSAKIVVPPLVLVLCLIHPKELLANKKALVVTALIVLVFVGIVARDPKILGFARVSQTRFSGAQIQKYGGITNLYLNNYAKYFSFKYLFEKGDQSPRASVKVFGEFYKVDLILLIAGISALLIKRKWKVLTLLGLLLVLSPVPGAISTMEPSATRGIYMLCPTILLSGFGAGTLVTVFKKNWVRVVAAVLILLSLGWETYSYLHYYYTGYSKADANEWQYGMKQAVSYVARNPEYKEVFMDKIRQQPYIFFLYYLKIPLPELLATVKYDESEAKSYNTVASFGKYRFGGWDIVQSYPLYRVLYIITPSYYGGLRYINELNVNDLIKYPDGGDAFYIVSGGREW